MRNGDIVEILFQVSEYINVYEFDKVLRQNSNPLDWSTPEMLMKILVERAITQSEMEKEIRSLSAEDHELFFKQAMHMASATAYYYQLNEEFKLLLEKKKAG